MAARKAARKAIESTYDSIVNVLEYKKTKDSITKLTSMGEIPVIENEPCKISFEQLQSVVQSESSAATGQKIKLFISPDVSIKPGSKIIALHGGNTAEYIFSGVPAIYDTHQEIMLELFKGWS
ncbi:MAG: hypothetical protein R3Y47_02130 [Lachnospiraceae bacterium]